VAGPRAVRLAAFGKRRGYDLSYADARPWLYGIATNLIGQHRREELRQYRIRQAAIPALDVPGHDEQVAADVTVGAVRGRTRARHSRRHRPVPAQPGAAAGPAVCGYEPRQPDGRQRLTGGARLASRAL
jgi:DNA-directed RNA polymerase specialized sigma24 family protein